MSAENLRLALLGVFAARTAVVELGDCSVLVREMSLAMRRDFHEAGKCLDGHALQAWLTTRAIVDETGQRVFTDADEDYLLNGRVDLLQKVAEAVLRLSGLAHDAEGGTAKKD